MKINISTKNFDITPSIKSYIEEKMNYLDRFTEEWLAEGGVEMDFDAGKTTNHHNKGNIYYAEANLKVPGNFIRVRKVAEDLHTAIDEVKEVMAQEVKEYKEKER
ncbi:MAG: ribosome-associated translation inhibitor RaiA [Candidatus Colwellbacteria bacterium]|jgi:ribosomal subunit interface protein|nr:ribosome-associated translation inhibitor RaiA [Candidatus Colwellbacteria bacterium]MCK9497753.1 ribosome-associated translation inhibitor RaiA [Candidatus Colwellbacteria bacterium]MDD3752608.1 ribosome-associated translation inhibitor RaiA [Candidatus Colwellbacteria bacterium]MDD4818827.1 ribosome-associated translation inhibitor RaiA [Candidatus Colwellbacteria bacterium]